MISRQALEGLQQIEEAPKVSKKNDPNGQLLTTSKKRKFNQISCTTQQMESLNL